MSEEALKERILDGGFAIALSGGGHRATLATLGALIAIVDRGLGPKVIQVASVSGGSITNAFVSQRCRLEEKLGRGDLDDIAKQLATAVIRNGVLTKGWIALLLSAPVLFGVVAAVMIRAMIVPWTWLAAVVGLSVTLAVLMARGLVVDWLLDRRYFRCGTSGPRSRALISSLAGRQVDHAFCMTDLALGLPVYVSSEQGGVVYRRLRTELDSTWGTRLPQTFNANQLSLAEIVRASAAFPGIAPLRLRVPANPHPTVRVDSPQLAFLADGGLWNNLGSQMLREDRFIGSSAEWRNGSLYPQWPAPKGIPLLCFNGSAALKPASARAFKFPGIALLKSLLRTTSIQNANTVLPRIEAMRRDFERRTAENSRPGPNDPLDLVADLGTVTDLRRMYRSGTWRVEDIRASDPKVKFWKMYSRPTPPEPQGSYPVCGLIDIEDWEDLLNNPAWTLIEKEADGSVDSTTTLGRIELKLARRLIARGYANTYLVSLFLRPLAGGELDQLGDFSDRLDEIVGA